MRHLRTRNVEADVNPGDPLAANGFHLRAAAFRLDLPEDDLGRDPFEKDEDVRAVRPLSSEESRRLAKRSVPGGDGSAGSGLEGGAKLCGYRGEVDKYLRRRSRNQRLDQSCGCRETGLRDESGRLGESLLICIRCSGWY